MESIEQLMILLVQVKRSVWGRVYAYSLESTVFVLHSPHFSISIFNPVHKAQHFYTADRRNQHDCDCIR